MDSRPPESNRELDDLELLRQLGFPPDKIAAERERRLPWWQKGWRLVSPSLLVALILGMGLGALAVYQLLPSRFSPQVATVRLDLKPAASPDNSSGENRYSLSAVLIDASGTALPAPVLSLASIGEEGIATPTIMSTSGRLDFNLALPVTDTPTPGAIAIAPTFTPTDMPTHTPMPTEPPTPTESPTPTDSPTPTETPTPTATPVVLEVQVLPPAKTSDLQVGDRVTFMVTFEPSTEMNAQSPRLTCTVSDIGEVTETRIPDIDVPTRELSTDQPGMYTLVVTVGSTPSSPEGESGLDCQVAVNGETVSGKFIPLTRRQLPEIAASFVPTDVVMGVGRDITVTFQLSATNSIQNIPITLTLDAAGVDLASIEMAEDIIATNQSYTFSLNGVNVGSGEVKLTMLENGQTYTASLQVWPVATITLSQLSIRRQPEINASTLITGANSGDMFLILGQYATDDKWLRVKRIDGTPFSSANGTSYDSAWISRSNNGNPTVTIEGNLDGIPILNEEGNPITPSE